jgi:hypothetical protein
MTRPEILRIDCAPFDTQLRPDILLMLQNWYLPQRYIVLGLGGRWIHISPVQEQ